MFEGRKARRLIDAVLQVRDSIPNHECEFNFVKPLVRLGAPAVGPLIQAFDTVTSDKQEWIVFKALVDMNDVAVTQLVAALSHGSEKIRAGAAHVMYFVHCEVPASPLIEAARRDRSTKVRCKAVSALASGRLPQEAFDTVVALLDDRDESVCESAISALGEIRYRFSSAPELVRYIDELLMGIIDRGSARLQRAAIWGLAGTDADVDRAKLIGHHNPDVRFKAIVTWGFPSDATFGDVLPRIRDANDDVRRTALNALAKLPASDLHVQAFIECLGWLDGETWLASIALEIMEKALAHAPASIGAPDLAAIVAHAPIVVSGSVERWEREAGWRPEDERYWTREENLTRRVLDLAAAEFERRRAKS